MNFQCFKSKCNLVRQFSLYANKQQKQSHYDCLGVTPKATQNDVKTAYYKLSKMYHPDLNKNNLEAASKFRDISEAYEVLGNVKSRKLYDRSLAVGGSDYTPISDEPVVENYKHASFYRDRYKLKTRVGEVKYNVDEWTQAHYSKTFSKAQTARETVTKGRIKDVQFQKEGTQNWQILAFILCIGMGGFLFSHDPLRGPNDISSQKNRKTD